MADISNKKVNSEVIKFALGSNKFQLIQEAPTFKKPFFKISDHQNNTILTFSEEQTRVRDMPQLNKLLKLFNEEKLTINPRHIAEYVDNIAVSEQLTQVNKILSSVENNLKIIKSKMNQK